MQCPVCHLDQVIVEFHDVELDLCIDGCGVWFDKDEIRQLFEVAGVPAGLYDLEDRLVFLPRGEYGPERRCPRCRGKMRHVSAPGDTGRVILDRCRRGHGLWFDQGELEAILSVALDESEEGDAALDAVRDFLGQFIPASERRAEETSAAPPEPDAEA